MPFQISAVVILLIFYGCYFTKMISQKRQGIQTDQLGKGKSGTVKRIEITVKLVSVIVPIAEVASIILNTSIFSSPVRWIGCSIALLGDVVFICSVLTMKNNWRAGVSESEKTELVTNGIYRISRNPAFLGFDLVYIGLLLAFFNWVLCILSVFALVMFHLQIVYVEEAFLQHVFGEDYLAYKKKVFRYFGHKFK